MPGRKQNLLGKPVKDLPAGWRIQVTERKNGNTKGKLDAYYYGPTNEKIRSLVQLRKHFDDTLNLDGFNFKTGRFEDDLSTPKVTTVSKSSKPKKRAAETSTTTTESMVPGTSSENPKPKKQAAETSTITTESMVPGTSSESRKPKKRAAETSTTTESMLPGTAFKSRKPKKRGAETRITTGSKVTGTTSKKRKSSVRDDAEMHVVTQTFKFGKKVHTHETTRAATDDDEPNQSTTSFDSTRRLSTASQIVDCMSTDVFEDTEENSQLPERILSKQNRGLLENCTERMKEWKVTKKYTKPKEDVDINTLIERKKISERMLAYLAYEI